MNNKRLGTCVFACSIWLIITNGGAPTWLKFEQSARADAPDKSQGLFREPVLVRDSPTNLRAFDVSWNDNSTEKYYLADRTNNAIDLVDSATDTFLGFIGRGHYTGTRPCPGQPKEVRPVNDGSMLGRYVYPNGQDGMEQPVWVRQTGLFYQNVPGTKNRVDVFDPHKLPRPVKSFPVECTGGLLGLTLSGLTVGPHGALMTVCGSVGGVAIDSVTGRPKRLFPRGLMRTRSGTTQVPATTTSDVAVVIAASEKFLAYIPLGSHSVAANARNRHIFVPVAGKGIFVVAPRKSER